MKKTPAFLAICVCSCFVHAASAYALDSATLTSYFGKLEGHWQGTGVKHVLQSDGTTKSLSYDFELESESSGGDGIWNVSEQTTDENHIASQDDFKYELRGGLLFISSYSVTDPIQPIEATETSLTYAFRRTEVLTGRSYDFTFHTEFSGDQLIGHDTTQTNGVTISDETFTAKRW